MINVNLVFDQQNARGTCLFLVIHLKLLIMTKTNVPKKIINFIAATLFISLVGSFFSGLNTLNAQAFYLGAKGGWSLPELSGGNNEISKGWKSRSAFNFGVLASDELTKKFALQIEVNYASQGGRKNGIQPLYDGAVPGLPTGVPFYANFKSDAILNYIEVPVIAKYVFLQTHSQRFYIDAGPYAGYLLNARNKTSGTSSIFTDKNGTVLMIPNPQNPDQYIPLPAQSFDANTNITSDIKKFNFGINGGLGVGQNLGNGNLFLDIKGYYGFLNIQKNPVNGKNNSGALVVSVGYAVKID